MCRIKIVVHGGVGSSEKLSDGCVVACKKGYEILVNGGSALDSVIESVKILEDDERYNAGTGSYMKLNGEIEMDAAVMCSDLKCGAVAAIKFVKNPVLIARKVMENTPHVLIIGEDATTFARKCGAEYYNPVTEKAIKKLHEVKKKIQSSDKKEHKWLINSFPELVSGTVGAVAQDKNGNFAGAVSTGGTAIMLPGRVGDSAIIGAGIYAGPKGAAVTTGLGEEIIRYVLCKSVYDMLDSGKKLEEICKLKLSEIPNDVPVGIIAVSNDDYAVVANKSMAHAIITEE